MQLEVPGKIDHVVCANGRRKLAWDSAEEYPVEFNPYSLQLCSEMKSKRVVVQAMEVYKQREKNQK